MADPAIPLSAPDVTDEDREAVQHILRGSQLSRGPWIEAFESALAEVAGRKHAVAVSSGTAALHVAAVLAGLGPGDEVLTTPFSFIASANVILHAGATPVFADIDPDNLNVDPDALAAAAGEKTRGIVAVHAFGRPDGIERVERFARERGLFLIEDACEAIGGRHAGRPLGSFGDASTLAFYPNKQVTSGEGGVLLTDDGAAAARARALRNQGRDPAGEGYLELGYNYRLTDMQAALGLSQLGRLQPILQRRREIADRYRERLEGIEGVVAPQGDGDGSWFVYVVRVEAGRDRILRGLREAGVGCAPYIVPIHLQPFYRERFGFRPGDFPNCERVAGQTIALPFFNRIGVAQQDRVVETLARLIRAPR